MSKSLKRVARVLLEANLVAAPVEMPGETRTAQQAADAVGCALDQIAKSIVFQGPEGCVLFVTAGGNQVDARKAADVRAKSWVAQMQPRSGRRPALPSGACRPSGI